uniref:DUF2117 domain-containing protein n=1 Tax=Candidatus Methanomethylicus mesodigestus TaxID=1867258 RepID=A0A7C3J2Y3_9CREN
MDLHLLFYDIETKKDPHGIRIRLVRELRRAGAIKVQRSAWVAEKITPSLVRLIDEFRRAGGAFKIAEWLPRTLSEVSGEAKSMVISLAVFGSEPFHKGHHDKIGSSLEQKFGCKVKLVPVGESAIKEYSTMAQKRTRLQDAQKPISRILDEAALDDTDALIIINYGRTGKSGIMYIAQALARTSVLRNLTSLPLLHVERLGEADGAILVWNETGSVLADFLKEELMMPIVRPSISLKKTTNIGERELRQIQYAMPGDAIVVNGVKIGTCLAEQVYLVAEKGRIVEIIGGKALKSVKKVRIDSLDSAIIKTV